MTGPHRNDIITALAGAGDDLGGDRLAFLTLTSKPGLHVRDAIAWRLHQQLPPPDRISSREWKRTDLAILNGDGEPLVLIETTAMATFDVVKPPVMAKFMGYLVADHSKATRLATEGTEVYLLLLVAHIADPVPPALMKAVKYTGVINSSLRLRSGDELRAESDLILDTELATLGLPVQKVSVGEGTAFSMRCAVTAYLIG